MPAGWAGCLHWSTQAARYRVRFPLFFRGGRPGALVPADRPEVRDGMFRWRVEVRAPCWTRLSPSLLMVSCDWSEAELLRHPLALPMGVGRHSPGGVEVVLRMKRVLRPRFFPGINLTREATSIGGLQSCRWKPVARYNRTLSGVFWGVIHPRRNPLSRNHARA